MGRVPEALKPFAEDVDLGDVTVQVLSLERLIEVKKPLTRPKDRLMLMHLEAKLARMLLDMYLSEDVLEDVDMHCPLLEGS